MHAYVQAAFPRVHAQLRREVVGSHSLLYTWQGSDSSLAPILLSGHLDVVPVETGTHTELLASGGHYAMLYHTQAAWYRANDHRPPTTDR